MATAKILNPLLAKFKKSATVKKTVENLLTVEEVAMKYFKSVSKAQIERYVKVMRPSEVSDFKKLFNAISSGLRLTGRIYEGIDKGGNAYTYIKFFSPKGEVECKVFPLGKLNNLIGDYQAGKVAINFKAEDLVDFIYNR
ncbi:hypothetical protein [Pedobacter sandarakinus]|uniref:hypothetical protein n=1 Tax=Pedobacter sandarakinus TaxID=353156 RepID=UPI002247EFF4|nr:hypothetical protein [Pedobacter sandarakinus]MCX2573664.1 hypothetical protein [Pedobacter sandarakinus]